MGGTSRFDCYPSDFLNGVIGLSADEIAAYTIVLMLQYDRGTPVQYAGREREIATRSGMSKGRLVKAVDGLLLVGKLTLESGKLFNARAIDELARIATIRAKNRENSEKGGFSTRAKFYGKRNDNKPDGEPDGQPNGGPNGQPYPSTNIVTEPKGSVTEARARDARLALEAFEKFWTVWPHKVGKPIAARAFAPHVADIEVILKGVTAYVRDKPADRPWLNPATFLNQRRWEDAPAPVKLSARSPPLGRRQLSSLETFQRIANGTYDPCDVPAAEGSAHAGPTIEGFAEPERQRG